MMRKGKIETNSYLIVVLTVRDQHFLLVWVHTTYCLKMLPPLKDKHAKQERLEIIIFSFDDNTRLAETHPFYQ
jgi:hypothetical protein